MSNEPQVWTTAQCLVALLQQEPSVVKKHTPTLRRAFDYIERSRLKSPERGWGYMQAMNWGVTEIDAWVAVAYIYSLRVDNAALIWTDRELPDVIARTRIALDLLLERQFDEGGWSAIEKTSNPKHMRTYSTIMALWAIVEAQQNGDVFVGDEARLRAALASGVKWIMALYTTNASGFSGWWPNPSSGSSAGGYPGLTAQTLFVLSKVEQSNPFVGADPRYKDAIEAFVTLAFEGNAISPAFAKRKIGDNERPHDADGYFSGRTETAEQSTFLLVSVDDRDGDGAGTQSRAPRLSARATSQPVVDALQTGGRREQVREERRGHLPDRRIRAGGGVLPLARRRDHQHKVRPIR